MTHTQVRRASYLACGYYNIAFMKIDSEPSVHQAWLSYSSYC